LYAGSPEANVNLVAAFRKGLSESGYVEGHNVAIEYRWAHNDKDRLLELATDLVRRRGAVIATPGSILTTLAANTASPIIALKRLGAFAILAGERGFLKLLPCAQAHNSTSVLLRQQFAVIRPRHSSRRR